MAAALVVHTHLLLHIMARNNIYFASDLHLGAPTLAASQKRERHFVRWLNHIKPHAKALYLVGDTFDYWFEYNTVIPKGYVRFLGKLAEMHDEGIAIHLFTGNHDLWLFSYLQTEIGVQVHTKPLQITLNKQRFFIAHGDGLGPGDWRYKIAKRLFFTNPLCQWLLAFLHPDITLGLFKRLSKASRKFSGHDDDTFLGEEQERLIVFAKQHLKEQHVNHFIFGHRHWPIILPLKANSQYCNLGDWIKHYSYAVFDGQNLSLQYFEP